MERKIRILFADDQEPNRRAFFASYRLDYEITLCASGEEALSLLESEDFDIIIADHYLKGISGLELLASIKNNPVPAKIAISAARDNSDLELAYEDGKIFSYLAKPWRPDDLEKLIDDAVKEISERKLNSNL